MTKKQAQIFTWFWTVVMQFIYIYAISLAYRKNFSLIEWGIFLFGVTLALNGQIYYTFLKGWKGSSDKADGVWTGGPFKLVRHPYYGGLIIMAISAYIHEVVQVLPYVKAGFFSFGLIKQQLLYLVLMFILVKISLYQEKNLVEMHGDEARVYFKKVRARWIPFVV
ncbi:MAG: methyltransferase family protein [Candidatus Moraniibacteriota bacterium]|jgi:protein-S-isoprenylcysteine O-methyltransferase Ste14